MNPSQSMNNKTCLLTCTEWFHFRLPTCFDSNSSTDLKPMMEPHTAGTFAILVSWVRISNHFLSSTLCRIARPSSKIIIISMVSSYFVWHKNLHSAIKRKELLTDTIILKSLKSIMLRKKEPYKKATYCSVSFMIFQKSKL